MVLYVSPYVNHKIKYPKETIWLKLENTSIRIFVVIYMYIWNLIITVPCCFPVNCIVLKVVEHSYSMLYQHSNITESGGGGGDMPNWTILRNYEALLYYLLVFFISSYKKIDFLYQEINPISWYQNFIFWFKEIHFLISRNPFLDIKKLNWFFYIKKSDGFFLYHRFFSYQEIDLFITKIDFWYHEVQNE